MRCNQKHRRDCSATPGRCYICRGEGIDGGTASIWEEVVSIVGKQVIERKNVHIESLKEYRDRGWLPKASNSQ
jgi:hypothetical protein